MHSRITLLSTLALALMSHASMAQPVYKIVGPDGRVTFSDKPPASTEKGTVAASGGVSGPAAGSDLPFELRQVAARYPVTLYTTASCGPCDSGRSLLRNRGIPFTERTITTVEDQEALQRLAGDNSVPFATLGSQKLKGFSDLEWTQYLDAAGYPSTSVLPKTYRYAAPAPLVAVQKPAAIPKEAPKPVEAPRVETAAPPPNPAGITF
ncbi:MAG: glutaredoxin family protein [Curvibacter sp.]|nr:MAG: glutaredoxin family protein [Curvibacter sp.]